MPELRSLWHKSKARGLILIINIGSESRATEPGKVYENTEDIINEGVNRLIWLS